MMGFDEMIDGFIRGDLDADDLIFGEVDALMRKALATTASDATSVDLPGRVQVSAKVFAEMPAAIPQLVRNHIAVMRADSRGAGVINRSAGAFRSETNGIVLKSVIGLGNQARTYVMTVEEAARDFVEMWFEVSV